MQPNDPRLHALRDSLAGRVLRGSGGQAYHLRERIGEGGQGWVFKAEWDEPGGFNVIVKVLRPDAVTRETLTRFQREAEVLRMLAQQARPNPYIVRFFDHAAALLAPPQGGEPLNLPFTVLEYVHGPTLEQVLSKSKAQGLPVDRVRRLVRHVVLALDHVHAQKIVHRDLKPSNILLATDGASEVAKVTDFGLVKLVDVNLQRTTALAGASLGYAPPEQYEQGNQRVSAKTDVFSLAAITFEMLTGRTAFPYKEGENPLLIVTRILNGPRPSFARWKDSLPPELQTRPDLVEKLDVEIMRATASDPEGRHESATEFWNALDPIFRAASLHEPPRSYSPMPRAAVTAPDPELRRGSSPSHAAVVSPGGSVPAPPESRTSPVPQVPDQRVSSPSAWKWHVRTRSIRAGTVRAAAFAGNGDVAYGVGAGGVARWSEAQGWVAMALPPGVEARAVRGLMWLRTGDLVFFGEGGLAGRMAANGAHEIWAIPDRDLVLLGAHHDDGGGMTTLVGERAARAGGPRPSASTTIGAIAQVVDARVTLLSESTQSSRLRAATRLRKGTLLACGDWGALVRLELGVAEFVGAVCGGHLTAIQPLSDGGALVVGAGGHALSISPRLEAQLEAVQTTRDLMSLAIADDGSPWAGAAQARLLRRTNGSWVRMSGDVGISSGIVSLWAGARGVRAVCDDGAVIEGVLA